MDIEYYNLRRPSVKYLIQTLQKIVDDNPDINFHKVGATLNDEYIMNGAELVQWEHKWCKRVCVDIY